MCIGWWSHIVSLTLQYKHLAEQLMGLKALVAMDFWTDGQNAFWIVVVAIFDLYDLCFSNNTPDIAHSCTKITLAEAPTSLARLINGQRYEPVHMNTHQIIQVCIHVNYTCLPIRLVAQVYYQPTEAGTALSLRCMWKRMYGVQFSYLKRRRFKSSNKNHSCCFIL